MIQHLFFVPLWNLGKTGQEFLKISMKWSFKTIFECRKHVTLFKKLALVPKKAAKLRKEKNILQCGYTNKFPSVSYSCIRHYSHSLWKTAFFFSSLILLLFEFRLFCLSTNKNVIHIKNHLNEMIYIEGGYRMVFLQFFSIWKKSIFDEKKHAAGGH